MIMPSIVRAGPHLVAAERLEGDPERHDGRHDWPASYRPPPPPRLPPPPPPGPPKPPPRIRRGHRGRRLWPKGTPGSRPGASCRSPVETFVTSSGTLAAGRRRSARVTCPSEMPTRSRTGVSCLSTIEPGAPVALDRGERHRTARRSVVAPPGRRCCGRARRLALRPPSDHDRAAHSAATAVADPDAPRAHPLQSFARAVRASCRSCARSRVRSPPIAAEAAACHAAVRCRRGIGAFGAR